MRTSSFIENQFSTQIPETAIAIGLDIGGTKISAARVSLKEGMVGFNKTTTPTQGQAFLKAIAELVEPLLADSYGDKPQCLGIASAGTVNFDTGEIFGATGNLPALRDIGNLKTDLEKLLDLPVYIENDANAAAFGEARMGAAKNYNNVLMITLGTGVGVGIIIENRMVRGAHYSAAEGGHICISMNQDRLCTCGKWDCWETYASGGGLAETARQELSSSPNWEHSLIIQDHNIEICAVTSHEVVDAWKKGDPIAQNILDRWHYHIATGLGSLLNVLDPAITVVGGGMAQFVNYDRLLSLTQERSMYKQITIVPAELGNRAGIMGAALLALERTHGIS